MTRNSQNSKAFTVGFAAILVSAISSIPLAVSSIFIPPMVEEFQSSVTAVTLFATISAFSAMLASFFLGTLIKQFSFKALISVGGILSGLLMICIGFSSNLYIIYIAAFLQGIGLVISGSAMTQTILSRWFVEKRGFMMSMILVFTMTISAILNVALSAAIEVSGYKTVAMWLGIISAIVVVVLGLLFIVDDPAKLDLKPYGYTNMNAQQTSSAKKHGVVNFTLKQGLARFPLWAILIYRLITAMSAQAIANQAANYFQSVGCSAVQSGYMIAITSIMGVVFSVIAGILADKKGPTFSAVITAGSGAVAFLLAFLWSGMSGAMIASVFFAGVTASSLYGPTMITRLYGTKDAGSMLGFNSAAGNIGSMIGPIIAASFFDKFGNYTIGFEFIGILLVLAILLSVIAGSERVIDSLKERDTSTLTAP